MAFVSLYLVRCIMWDAWREFGPVAIDGLFDEFFLLRLYWCRYHHPFYVLCFYILLDIGLRRTHQVASKPDHPEQHWVGNCSLFSSSA